MAKNVRLINEFLARTSSRSQIAEVVRRAGFEFEWVREEDNGKWWCCYLKPNLRVSRTFGTVREILLSVSEYENFQARTILRAQRVIEGARPRLSEDFSIVITKSPETARHVEEFGGSFDTSFIGFSSAEIMKYRPHGQNSFLDALQGRLYSRDLYDHHSAITKSNDFFGRKAKVADLATRLRSGSRHVGLFGLRKIGKTSLLYRLRSILRNDGSSFVAHVDIERADAVNPSAGYLLWSLGESLLDSHKSLRSLKRLKLFGRYNLFSEIPTSASIYELFHHDIKLILSTMSRSLILMFDEVELMSPTTKGSSWGESFVRVWRLLRGIDQENPGRIGYLVTGTNPHCFEVNDIDGRENPVYNYFSVEYLKPFTREDTAEVLEALGKRMRMVWDDAAINFTFSATGGHPALVRTFGSAARRIFPNAGGERRVTLDMVREIVPVFLVERSSLLSQIVAVLEDQYDNEYYLLQLLAKGELGEFRELAAAFPEDTAHLNGYGLCGQPAHCSGLDIELLQTFLQARTASKRDRSYGNQNLLSPGTTLDEYEITTSIGNSGGFARVYSVLDRNRRKYAVKVFKNGLLSALQRELDALQQISHPNVVKIHNFGRTSEGLIYMVMDYLEGPTLKRYCTVSGRAAEKEVISWLRQLLSALIEIHPNAERVTQLRKLTDISPEQLAELAEARHGFVHRDIKPENIVITSEGPILIDFNISVRASAPVETMSATFGYLPPDGLPGAWVEDVDLYQLGLTFLQASVGVEYTGENITDIRTLAHERLTPGLSSLLLKMTSIDRKDRFPSAREAYRQVVSAFPAPPQ
ncbi:protein kinase [Streptomyces sp. NBC_00838]|uniref:protein kinase domain-containing protein n=1 Tax=Streptomyces sp. NBC_00838 TaxID=2903680 RepID=UPI003864E619|nr:protein kinase [Streptomyces sp. NBC_00838]